MSTPEKELPARMSDLRELAARAVRQAQDMQRLARITARTAAEAVTLNAEIAAVLRADPELHDAVQMAEEEPVGHLEPDEV